MTRLPVLEVLWRDVKYAVRVLARTPAFALTAIVTLALVIGANSAVFSLADALLLRPLPLPSPDRLAVVTTRSGPSGSEEDESQDGRTWEVLHGHVAAIDIALAASGFGHDVNLVVDRQASMVGQSRVSAGYFRVLGVPPAYGREFTEDEDRTGGPAVAVLSYPLWQRVFHGDTAAIGQSILLRGEPYQVVGIMPEAFQTPGTPADVWTPARPSTSGEGGGTNYEIVARVKDGHTWTAADGELRNLSNQRYQPDKDDPKRVPPWMTLKPMQDTVVEDVRQPIEMLTAAVGMVLLIACVNLAALLLSRGGSRTKEIATRMALGSGRGAVIRQLMIESVVLGLAGGLAGVLVGAVALEGLKTLGGPTYSSWTRVTLDARVLAATMGLSVVTSLIFGLVPALQASRLDVNVALTASGSRAIAGGARHWLRRSLVIAEVALGVVLLVITALLIRTFVNLRSLDPGFDPKQLATIAVSLQDARYQTAVQINHLFDESLAELKRTPGVESAAVSLELPYKRLLNDGFRFADAPPDANSSIANFTYVTADFFATFRIPVHKGRGFTEDDRDTSPPVAIVNEAFVRAWSKDINPIGRRLKSGTTGIEIVGVVGDVQVANAGFNFPGRTPGPAPIMTAPLVFRPASQEKDGFFRLVHTWFSPVWSVRAATSVNAAAAIQHAIGVVDPLLPLGRVQSMTDVQASAMSEQRLLMTLVGVLAATAILLAALGIHGILAHAINERRREFGIRLALGATAGRTMRQVAMSGVMLAAVGAAIGMGLAWIAVRLVESFLYGVQGHDPSTYLGVAAFLLAVAAVASIIPALKILRVDPAETLRS